MAYETGTGICAESGLRATREAVAMGFIAWLIIGAIAGWLAGKILRGSGYGLIGDIVIGIIGGYIGGWLFGVLGLPPIGGGTWIGPLITATVGAIVLLLLIRLIRR
jgi:uncharacterized membrane protein YeaQ/YmgE (transglycosylase-associated protein family)